MKYCLILILILIFSFSSNAKNPFFWLVEKDGKSSYILGSIPVGLSLNEIPCSNEISEKIQNSQLLLIEAETQSDFDNLSEEDKKKLFIGSNTEKKEIMSRLSLKTQEMIRKKKANLTNKLKKLFRHRYENISQIKLNDFSPDSQTFLINQGADPEESYSSLFYFLNTIAYYRAYYSLPSLDEQIKQIALSHSIQIQSLNDNTKLYENLKSDSLLNKPLIYVRRNDIEKLINNLDSLSNLFQEILLNKVHVYTQYNINFFNQIAARETENLDNQDLLKQQNELWFKKFLTAHNEYESIFLSADLKHFSGEYSLLDNLKKEGFSIKMVTCLKP